MEIRFVGVKKEQRRIILKDVDPMSGHMGVKRTLNRISERFIWPGMCALRAMQPWRSGFATLVTPQHKCIVHSPFIACICSMHVFCLYIHHSLTMYTVHALCIYSIHISDACITLYVHVHTPQILYKLSLINC